MRLITAILISGGKPQGKFELFFFKNDETSESIMNYKAGNFVPDEVD